MSMGLIADLIVRAIPPRNPIRSAMIVEELANVGGGRMVSVYFGGGVYAAMFSPPVEIVIDGLVFVTRTGPALTDPYVVVATNYQVDAAPTLTEGYDGIGYGEGSFGESYGGYYPGPNGDGQGGGDIDGGYEDDYGVGDYGR